MCPALIIAQNIYLYRHCNNTHLAALNYYIALPFLYLLSWMPFRLLYILSDFFYFFLYHIIGYRKKVVLTNLRNSFPDKSDREINIICKKFYHYFCDLFLETFKTLTITREEMLKHCSMDTSAIALFERLAGENRSFLFVLGHKGNWEWGGNTFSILSKHQLYVIYHPITNKYFDSFTYRMRTRFGGKLIEMKNTFRDMMNQRGELTATAFIADQTPPPDKAYWLSFLNQDTPVFMGTEKIARKMKYPIVYITIKKLKRGYYTMFAELLASPPYLQSDGEITAMFTKKLEQDIIEQPETWLWTHRRWKHKRPQ
ncbi:MAG: lysophospholipid acyltransferase family protein [Bacteroidota bacterium]